MIQAITLSGGGAYGAFEVGVLKALMGGHAQVTGGEPLDPKIYTGTSAGAFITSVLLSSEAEDPKGRIDHLEHIWFDEVCESPERDGVFHDTFWGSIRWPKSLGRSSAKALADGFSMTLRNHFTIHEVGAGGADIGEDGRRASIDGDRFQRKVRHYNPVFGRDWKRLPLLNNRF